MGDASPASVSRRRETRSGGKSSAAFRTISEVADELDVAQHVLRFWESKFSQVRPLKRAGGRRYYRPEDVALLQQIRELLYTQRYTIKGAQQYLREQRRAGGEKPPGDKPSAAAAADKTPSAAANQPSQSDRAALPEDVRARLRKLRAELVAIRAVLRQ